MLAEESLLSQPLGHPLSALSSSLIPPTHQQLPPSISSCMNKSRTEMHADIPAKKAKTIDDASSYQLDYQRYQSLMYAHCAQQQHVGQISAFRPWAPPKSFLHAYNAAAVAALCLSQEPPVLQNPERVVRCSDRERFERTYQPNVALAPRKGINIKELDRERERERMERERERELVKARDHSRECERERERELEKEREKEKELERELKQLQNQTQRHEMFFNLPESDVQVHIKKERANSPCSLTPPPANASKSSTMESQHMHLNNHLGPMQLDNENQPVSLSIYHQAGQQHHAIVLKNNGPTDAHLQPRRGSLQASNSSTCSTSSSISSISPPEFHQQHQHQQQPLDMYQHYQQQQQQQQQQNDESDALRKSTPSISPPSSIVTTNSKCNIFAAHQQQSKLQRQNNQLSCSTEEISSSNEITSSTSPIPATTTSLHQEQQQQQQQQQHQYQQQHQIQSNTTMISTINQHAKLLPTGSSIMNVKSYDEMNSSRIRINKNLIQQPNIVRSPTPPLTIKSPVSQPAQQQQQQTQSQTDIHEPYAYCKQRESCYTNFSQPQLQQQQQQQQTVTGLNLSTNKKHMTANFPNKYQQYHNGIASRIYQQQQQQHTGSGEFELSTDTDDESLNGEPDSSMNALPPWEMAVEALRDTRPKARERVLQLIQRLLHDNQQYRYTNLKLNELLQRRESQIRELSNQLQEYKISLEQQQQQQQQQQQRQVVEEGNKINDDNIDSSQNEEMRVPLKKSYRRDAVINSAPNNNLNNNNLNKETQNHNEEECVNALDISKQKKAICEENSTLNNEDTINLKANDIKGKCKQEKQEVEEEEEVDEKCTDLDTEMENDSSNQSMATYTCQNTKEEEDRHFKNKSNGHDDDDDNDEDDDNIMKVVQNTKISLCTNQKKNQETECSDNDEEEEEEDCMKNDDHVDELSDKVDVKKSTAAAAISMERTPTDDANLLNGLTFESSTDSNKKAVVIKKRTVCSSSEDTTNTDDMEIKQLLKKNQEKRTKEISLLLKKKKKKKERKERKEKRRAAAAALAAHKYDEVTTVASSVLRPPMVTKASKKQTPLTTNSELQPIKQEQLI